MVIIKTLNKKIELKDLEKFTRNLYVRRQKDKEDKINVKKQIVSK